MKGDVSVESGVNEKETISQYFCVISAFFVMPTNTNNKLLSAGTLKNKWNFSSALRISL